MKDSMGLRNAKLEAEARAFSGGTIDLRTGVGATSPNDAMQGTLLATITLGGTAHTSEVQATGSVQLTAGGAGNTVTNITVNSIEILGATVTYTTDLPTTAQLVADQINRYRTKTGIEYTAVSDGAAQPTITITAQQGVGTGANGWTVASTVTGFSKTDTNMSGGVASANGLTWEFPTAGVLAKRTTETWSGTAIAAGNIGHMVLKGPIADNGAASQTLFRKILSVGISGADVNLPNGVALDVGVPFIIPTVFNIRQPESR